MTSGFATPVLSAQTTFRAVLNALARPGSVHPMTVAVSVPPPLAAGAAAIALTLCDHDTPIWLDAGYRIIPNFYVGAFFQYGFGFIGNNFKMVCDQSGVSCSTHVIMFGVNAHYHFLPSEELDPWAGIGFGYEILDFSVSQGSMSVDVQAQGWQFVNVQVGADYHAAPGLGVGPFIALSLGQYQSASLSIGSMSQSQDIQHQALHEWLTLGVRGAYDISIE